MNPLPTTTTPYRQIRAQYDSDTITVYQAYSATIASAAVKAQRLNASPEFRLGRMTWIKPSWAWMMYRSGYSYKDKRQERILAIKMKHEHFLALLEKGTLSTHSPTADGAAPGSNGELASVRIQWDPERTPHLNVLPYRSIQIGISASMSAVWVNEWIVSIEDVTDRARHLYQSITEQPDITIQELVDKELVPIEVPYDVPEHVSTRLDMSV